MISGVLVLNSGVRCVSRFYENINLGDLDLTTALLSAIVQFSKELKEGEIHQVELGKHHFYITSENVINFVLIVSQSSSETTAHNEYYWKKLEEIKKIFFVTFTKEEIRKKTGELEHFTQFIPILDQILEEKREKIHDSFFSAVSKESEDLKILYVLDNDVKSVTTNTLLSAFYTFIESEGVNLLYGAWPYPFVFSTNSEPAFLFVQNYYLGRLTKNTQYIEPSIVLGFKFHVNQLRDVYYLAYYFQVLAETILSKYRILYRPIFYNKPITGLFTTMLKQNPYHITQLNEWFNFQNLIAESSLYMSSQLEDFKRTSESTIICAPLEIHLDKILLNIKDMLPQVIYSLLTQRRLIVLGEKNDVVLLLRFIHHIFRVPIFNLWSNDPNPLSLINGHPVTTNLEKYPKEALTIIDLTNHKVKYGFSNSYCEQFSYGIMEFKYYGLEKLREYVDDKLNRLFNSVSKIINCYDINSSNILWKDILTQIFTSFSSEDQEMILHILEKISPYLALKVSYFYHNKKHTTLKNYLMNINELYPKQFSELTFIQVRVLSFLSLAYRTQTIQKN